MKNQFPKNIAGYILTASMWVFFVIVISIMELDIFRILLSSELGFQQKVFALIIFGSLLYLVVTQTLNQIVEHLTLIDDHSIKQISLLGWKTIRWDENPDIVFHNNLLAIVSAKHTIRLNTILYREPERLILYIKSVSASGKDALSL